MIVIPLLAAATVLALAWALLPLFTPSPLARRARALRAARPPPPSRAPQLAAKIAHFVHHHAAPDALRRAADQARHAGWSHPESGAGLLAARWLLPLVLALLAAAILLPGRDLVQGPALLLLLAIAGHFAPVLLASNMAARRLTAIRLGLADALDLLVICAESGLGLDVALARTGRELAPAHPALAAELRLTALELGFLPNRADALANLARRVPIDLVTGLGAVLTQTERFGTPLAEALRTMATEARTARLLRAEARATRLPALMTVPMIAFVLPPLFVVLIGPAVVTTLSR